jgi:hypothetical protein
MSMPFYSYEHRQGLLSISWNDVFSLCKGLALAIEPYQAFFVIYDSDVRQYPPSCSCSSSSIVGYYPVTLERRRAVSMLVP